MTPPTTRTPKMATPAMIIQNIRSDPSAAGADGGWFEGVEGVGDGGEVTNSPSVFTLTSISKNSILKSRRRRMQFEFVSQVYDP